MVTSQPVELTFQAYRQSLPTTISEADAYQGYLIDKKRINGEAVLAKAEQLEKEKQKTVRMQQGLPARWGKEMKWWSPEFSSLFLTPLSTALGIFTGLTVIRVAHDNPQRYVTLLWGYQKCFGKMRAVWVLRRVWRWRWRMISAGLKYIKEMSHKNLELHFRPLVYEGGVVGEGGCVEFADMGEGGADSSTLETLEARLAPEKSPSTLTLAETKPRQEAQLL
ncbi:uncharacterized protein EV422DRAFT_510146 [Fimicolochytrium jonesii]|uniref:uncharacterized protein n=1 Tax=Fimicolochytrium jonesii TaxID=1396493 RepID=UPI0022FE6BE0|nr:uncharacterized protein EV422DRAFT_510146 [Fimicolochytrium jonesii]KAI8816021.1 hypothetical protein EV422DRAFT_510146 [Fimicolochytrium jonesii]